MGNKIEMANGAQVKINTTPNGYQWELDVFGKIAKSPQAFLTILEAKGSLREALQQTLSLLHYNSMPPAKVEMW